MDIFTIYSFKYFACQLYFIKVGLFLSCFICFGWGILEDTVTTKSEQNSYGNINTIIRKFTIKSYNIAMKIINHEQSEGLSTLGTNNK